MSPPAMPSPARVVSRSLTHLGRKGYTPTEARKIICDVVESISASKHDFEPWAIEWLRGLWRAAAPNPPAPRHSLPGWECPRCHHLFIRPGIDHEPCGIIPPAEQSTEKDTP